MNGKTQVLQDKVAQVFGILCTSGVDDEEDGNPKSTCRYVTYYVSIFKVFQLQSQSVLILTPIQALNIVIRRYRSHESQPLFSEDIY